MLNIIKEIKDLDKRTSKVTYFFIKKEGLLDKFLKWSQDMDEQLKNSLEGSKMVELHYWSLLDIGGRKSGRQICLLTWKGRI